MTTFRLLAVRPLVAALAMFLAAPTWAADSCDFSGALKGGLFATTFADVTERDRADPDRWQRIVNDISHARRTFEDTARDKRVLVGWKPTSEEMPSASVLKEQAKEIVAFAKRSVPSDVDVQGTVLEDAAPAVRVDMRWPGPQGGERQVITHIAVKPRCLLTIKVSGRNRSPEDTALWNASLAEVDRIRATIAKAPTPTPSVPASPGTAPGMNAADALKMLPSIGLLLLPLVVTVLLGGVIYSFAWRLWLPKGNRLGRAYCVFIMLGTGGWMALVLLADPALRAANPTLAPASVLTPTLMFAVHTAAFFRPRSRWFALALSLVAGNLLTSAGLIAFGLTPGPTLGHIVGFLIGGGLLWLVARRSLTPYSVDQEIPMPPPETQPVQR